MDDQRKDGDLLGSKPSREQDTRRLRVLWLGLGLYFLIMLNALRYAGKVPYQILIIGSLINAAIILAIIVAIKRLYRRLKK